MRARERATETITSNSESYREREERVCARGVRRGIERRECGHEESVAIACERLERQTARQRM